LLKNREGVIGDREAELLLAEFGEYLLRSRLTDEKHAPFFVGWVRRHLATTPHIPHATPTESRTLFLDNLQRAQTPDWQVEQARQATSAWSAWRDQVQRAAPAPKVAVGPDGTVPVEAVQAAMRETLRVRHYSYRTEQTYLDWVRRFFAYLEETGATVEGRPMVGVNHYRDFISQLATRQHVAAGTQNQAFGALLFLFREILGVEVGDLGRTVRARRGERLPTVLSPDEVRRLLGQMSGTARLIAEVIYGGGLRVMECCRLRVQDVDFDNELLRVRGKGDKDRTTLLPQSVREGLRAHLARVRTL
jgi:integrase